MIVLVSSEAEQPGTNPAIDKDDALGHSVYPQNAACFRSLSCCAMSLVSEHTDPMPSPCLAALFDGLGIQDEVQTTPQSGKRPSPIWGIWTRLV